MIEKRMKKEGVASRRAQLYEKVAKGFLEEFEKVNGFLAQGILSSQYIRSLF